jgi:thiamine kinase-like enzyme
VRTEGWRVCPVDWEMAAVGPGLIDLAALTAGWWTAHDSRAVTEEAARQIAAEEIELCSFTSEALRSLDPAS